MIRACALACSSAALLAAQRPAPFAIRVVDGATGRGVPMVELETTNRVLFVTDSNGIAAIDEPGLAGRSTFFHVRAHGYRHPADGFGYRGFRRVVEPGGSTTVEVERINVAERLYRVTGADIYRDSLLVGTRVPIREPLLAGGVFGQDSVVNAVYGDRLYWFWGDTNRAAYPLGNFAVSGATSRLPADGGLAPATGVDLSYFTADGFARPMCPIDGPGPVWIFGLMVVSHEGRERMVCHYARVKTLDERHEHGIARWNDDTERFEKVAEFPLDAPLYPSGNPTRVTEDGVELFYFPNPYPAVRVAADYDAIVDPARYEAFTCLRPGARWRDDEPPLERRGGALVWSFERDTDVVTPRRWRQLVDRGLARDEESWMGLRDVETGARVTGHGGTVTWNGHRGRWILIGLEAFGRSMLGEVWFAEADTLLGPWGYARRVVTHDRYSFYNVKQHPYFDEDGGRLVYFEGTYTTTFSGNDSPTPRYDYNQIMYRIDLDDPRLELPVPVYEVEDGGERRWLTAAGVRALGRSDGVRGVPFWALDGGDGGYRPAERAGDATAELYAWTDGERRLLRVEGDRPAAGWQRTGPSLGHVWPSPNRHPPLGALRD